MGTKYVFGFGRCQFLVFYSALWEEFSFTMFSEAIPEWGCSVAALDL